MNLWRWLQMRCRDEVAQLWADVHRLENENAELTREALADRKRYRDVVECNHDQAEIITKLRQTYQEHVDSIVMLRIANDEATERIKKLEDELETAQYMRNIVSRCRDDAEARAGGYGKYTPGAV